MVNFKKVIPFIIAVLFFNNSLYSHPASEDSLRVPVGETELFKRMAKGVSERAYPLDDFYKQYKDIVLEKWDYKELSRLLKPIVNRIRWRYRMSHIIEVDDMVQEVVIEIRDSYKNFRGGKFSLWAFNIGRNTMVDKLREHIRGEKQRLIKTPSEYALRQKYEWLEFLRKNLKFLTERQKEVIELYLDRKNFTFTQIADILDIQRVTVRQRYREAIIRIVVQKMIQEEKNKALEFLKQHPDIMKEEQRKIMELWLLQGESYGQIASKFNKKYEAVHSTVRKGSIKIGYKEPDEREIFRQLFAQVADTLAKKENEIMELWLNGESYKSIADSRLGLSYGLSYMGAFRRILISAKAKLIEGLFNRVEIPEEDEYGNVEDSIIESIESTYYTRNNI